MKPSSCRIFYVGFLGRRLKEEVEFRREAVEDGARLGRVHSSTVRAGDS